ncbi:hypothetical protein [Amycolatopsis sp. cg13]|uniref:hypothetical protein n=1 Tax=Amycolatopsis sp. cg13 TaxID=3238807 RepID=UPI00352486C0
MADALNTGPASLYAHVVNKTDLDELLIARLSAKIDLPKPDGAFARPVRTDLRPRGPGQRCVLARAPGDRDRAEYSGRTTLHSNENQRSQLLLPRIPKA